MLLCKKGEKMEQENKQTGKLWLALLLSFLVCLAGSILWGLVYSFGWFVSIVAYVTALCAFLVYEKVYKKTTKLAFVWILLWIIALNALVCFAAIVIGVAIQENSTLAVALEATLSVFDKFAGQFLLDMFLGAVFGILGVVSYYKYQKRAKLTKQAQEQLLQAQLHAQQSNNEAEQPETEEVKSEAEVLRCKNCGARLKENSSTCEFCGKKN